MRCQDQLLRRPPFILLDIEEHNNRPQESRAEQVGHPDDVRAQRVAAAPRIIHGRTSGRWRQVLPPAEQAA